MIGVTALYDDEKDSLWLLPGYMDALRAAGGLPVMLPLEGDAQDAAQLARSLSGFLFTGGHDVAPALYGEEPHLRCGPPCPRRDEFESLLLREVLALDKPFLGICRGLQLLNVLLGGDLYQHIPAQLPSHLRHAQKPPYHLPKHTVSLLPGTPLRALLETEELPVNSYHHQGLRRMGTGLLPMARSEEGLVEAAWLPGRRFVWGVQWHPEFAHSVDPAQAAIFGAFLAACQYK